MFICIILRDENEIIYIRLSTTEHSLAIFNERT